MSFCEFKYFNKSPIDYQQLFQHLVKEFFFSKNRNMSGMSPGVFPGTITLYGRYLKTSKHFLRTFKHGKTDWQNHSAQFFCNH